jgi:hypothetical protein
MGTAGVSASLTFLMNHTNTVSKLAPQGLLASDAVTYGIPYFIGETNSFAVGIPRGSPAVDCNSYIGSRSTWGIR